MRKISFAVFACAALILASSCVADGVPLPQHARATPSADANTSPPSASSAIGPELTRLGALAGRWTVRQSMWGDPAKPPAIDRGTATFMTVLGGRHVRQDLRIDSAKPFRGLGYLGYDRATGRYDSLWMDVNFGGMILAHGSYDPAAQTYTFTGAMPDPARRGATSPLREVMHVVDEDHFVYEYYERHAGKEMLAVRLEYTRGK